MCSLFHCNDYTTHDHFNREAICIVRSRDPTNTERILELYNNWAKQLRKDANYETGAKWWADNFFFITFWWWLLILLVYFQRFHSLHILFVDSFQHTKQICCIYKGLNISLRASNFIKNKYTRYFFVYYFLR